MLLKEFTEHTQLERDRDLQVATASTRNAASWKNQQVTMSEFVLQLSRTVRTQETYEAFLAMPKSEQDDIKDVGGFVGGLLKGGRRSKSAVAYRSIMTLDADYAGKDFADIVRKMLGGYAWTIYSTHKHSPDKPRLRLVVYTDRPMQVDEYQAAMRKVAEIVGINFFDDTTYDSNRLMYWPSTSSDGEFFFQHNDAPFLPVDSVLAKYENWEDVTQWPTSERESKRLTRTIGKQADPLKKKGVVGAFCRKVSIYDAIEIVGVYKREGQERYTYTEGTSTKGAVVYDSKFLYSNHDSDPAGGQTLNAFDLVRVHKFGELDVDAKLATPTSKLPSYQAMQDFAREQPGIKEELIASGMEIDASDFDELADIVGEDVDPTEAPTGAPTDWLGSLQVADDGTIKTTFFNATEIVKHDTRINGLMAFNQLAGRVENSNTGDLWSEKDSLTLRKYVGRRYQCDFPEAKIEHAITDRAHARAFHPVQDWLTSLEWDGLARVDKLFVDWLKCDDNAYTREAARCVMIAAVARAFEPGYKFDNVPVLGGAQGIGKSTFVSILGGAWYGELSSFDHKIAAEEMQGKWVMEITELGATNRSELEQQKAFISATSTVVRMAYARHPTELKRQCVFIATTNQDEYLKDSSGNRRWWPIDCGLKEGQEVDFQGLREVVSQLWAEAYALYVLGLPALMGSDARKLASLQQSDKREADTWEGVIAEWLYQKCDANRYEPHDMRETLVQRNRVCIIEIWQDCLGQQGTPKRHDSNRISSVMKGMVGWEGPKVGRFGSRFGRQKGWVRPTDLHDDIPF